MAKDNINSNFTISPSLFIGLGTNGWKILDDLRKLMFEEFGRAGLHCCRYLALETDRDKKPKDNSFPHVLESYEKITPLYITVPSVDVVKKRLQSKGEEYKHIDGLREWLDPQLINCGIERFIAGAGHIRQAGRLCLWENWETVAAGLRKSTADIKDMGNHAATDAFLRNNYFPNKHGDIQLDHSCINDSPNVYICGTLCGGTCSGTFIDVAYFVRKLIGVTNKIVMVGAGRPKVVGLFTFINTSQQTDPNKEVHAVNSWTALRELDFYYREGSRYQVKFPDGLEIDTQDEPFQTAYLQSLTNSSGNTFKDEDALNQMCAMNLFTEVVTDMAGVKDAIRVNFARNPSYKKPNASGHLRTFSAFGLSAILYPRYRISQAINRALAIDMIDAWCGDEAAVNKNMVNEDVLRDWNKIWNQAKGSLMGTVADARCQENLLGKIDALFDKEFSFFNRVEWNEIGPYLSSFPRKAPLAGSLRHPHGDYYRKITINAGTLVVNDLKAAIEKVFIDYLTDHTIAETKVYIHRLVEIYQQTQNGLPENLPDSPKLVDFTPEQGALANPFGQWLRRRRSKSLLSWFEYLFNLAGWFLFHWRSLKAEKDYRRVVWDTIRQRAKDHLGKIRNYALYLVLEKNLQFMKEQERRLETVNDRLMTFKGTCETEMSDLIHPETASNVLIISQGNPNNLEDDVKEGVAKTQKSPKFCRNQFIGTQNQNPVALMENKSIDELVSLADKVFNQYSQSVAKQFKIGKQAVSNFKDHIKNLVKSSFPYVETVGEWNSLPLSDVPNRIFCPDQTAGKQLTEKANNHLAGVGDYKDATTTLDHFVFFYREIAGLAITDLEIHLYASQCLEASEKNPNATATNFTHRGGENYFNLQRNEDFKHLRWWIGAMRYLAPDLFKERGETLMLRYKNEHGMKVEISVEHKGTLTKELRQYLENHEAETLIDQFQEKLREISKSAVIQRMEAEVEKLDENDSKARSKLAKNHEEILAETFKGNEDDEGDSPAETV